MENYPGRSSVVSLLLGNYGAVADLQGLQELPKPLANVELSGPGTG